MNLPRGDVTLTQFREHGPKTASLFERRAELRFVGLSEVAEHTIERQLRLADELRNERGGSKNCTGWVLTDRWRVSGWSSR